MCIFADPVQEVADTKIFVASAEGRQYTAYQMQFEMPKLTRADIVAGRTQIPGNAMILPVPWQAGEAKIGLVDMSKCVDFFDKLAEMLTPKTKGSRGLDLAYAASFGDYLEVHKVGNFDVSVAYSVADIDRANPDVFRLGADAKVTLQKYYEGPVFKYAFVICALARDGKIHPLAYTSAAREKLFVPTRHEHGSVTDLPSWDHAIYTTASGDPVGPTGYKTSSFKQLFRDYSAAKIAQYADIGWRPVVAEVPELAPFVKGAALTRYTYMGKLPNQDVRIPMVSSL